MSNAHTVRKFLEESPNGTCDDCISQMTRVKPRQQVYQICHQLEQLGVLIRSKGRCIVCGHRKTLNVVPRGTSRPHPVMPEDARQASLIDGAATSGTPTFVTERLRAHESQLAQLLNSPTIRFDEHCRSALPEAHGIYRIFDPTKPDETVRAGRTKCAAGGLQQRVYRNHLMGNQAGNLRVQLVGDGVCAGLESAKQFIRENLVVQILRVDDKKERTWLEHFMLAVLRPRYCD